MKVKLVKESLNESRILPPKKGEIITLSSQTSKPIFKKPNFKFEILEINGEELYCEVLFSDQYLSFENIITLDGLSGDDLERGDTFRITLYQFELMQYNYKVERS